MLILQSGLGSWWKAKRHHCTLAWNLLNCYKTCKPTPLGVEPSSKHKTEYWANLMEERNVAFLSACTNKLSSNWINLGQQHMKLCHQYAQPHFLLCLHYTHGCMLRCHSLTKIYGNMRFPLRSVQCTVNTTIMAFHVWINADICK